VLVRTGLLDDLHAVPSCRTAIRGSPGTIPP
jgi:hypothetical protein